MENKLKILEGMDTFLPEVDGVITCMHNYCLNLNKIADVTAVAPRYKRNYIDNLPYKILRCNSMFLPILNVHYGTPSGDRKFDKQVMVQDYDIVHFHSPFNMSTYLIKVAKRKNIPIVATFHTNFRSIFQDIFKAKWLTETIIKNITKNYNKCDEIFVCSPQIAEQARSFGYNGKITILPFGSDYALCENVEPLKDRANKKFNLDPKEIVFIFTGRLMPLKRIDFIIDALKICKNKGLKFKFFVAGKGMALESLQKQVRNLDMEENVVFLGFVEQEDLDSLYARANLLLFPSLYDNFGLVKVEAAAFSTPGIYIENSQAGYGVTHGENGFLTADTLEDFANGIMTATSDLDKLDQIGINASKQLYISWEDCTKKLLARLTQIVEEKKGKIPVCNQNKNKIISQKKKKYTPSELRKINKRARKINTLRKKEYNKLVDSFYEKNKK